MVFRKPTKDEQLQGWKKFAFEINLHRTITMNHDRVIDCLKRLDLWVGAHNDANGERSEAEINQYVAEAFWRHIVKQSPPPKVTKDKL